MSAPRPIKSVPASTPTGAWAVVFMSLMFAGTNLSAKEDTFTSEQIEFFENKVRPVLATHCYSCHSAEATKLKAGLRLDSRAGVLKGGESGPAIVPGNPAKSLLSQAVSYGDPDTAMPPKQKLADADIAALTKWVEMGAPWPGSDAAASRAEKSTKAEAYDWEKFRREHWSFRPIVAAKPPKVRRASWVKGDIDRFVLARLEAAGVTPNPAAEKRTLIRRAYLDLIGLPPTPEQVAAFLNDRRSDAFAKVVDSLLASEHYGERWARHWLDVARYSEADGGFGDQPLPNTWRYRDWVVRSFNADLPYDRFLTEQIAGDLLAEKPDPAGTGFFAVGPTYVGDGGDPEAQAQAEAETLADRVDTFSRGLLGLTVACARCHDHKFDPITTKDYYAIAGVFRNTRRENFPVVPQAEVDAFKAGQQAIKDQEKQIDEWLHAATKRLNLKRPEVEKSLDEEAKKSLAELRRELERRKKSAPPMYATLHGLKDSGSVDMPVALRGDLRKPGEMAPRRFLEIVAGKEAAPYTKGSGRLELARSVVASDNPLTARVIVNRVWGWHFGEALVRTPSNFGVLGEKPTHPELLDWLAADFIQHGWSMKRLHRQILLSSTWQMSSHFDKAKFTRDGDNRLLWRMNPRKLEVEVWRDSLLAVTGELDRTIGGPSANQIWESKRRTVYASTSRTGDIYHADRFLRLFDAPAAVSSAEKRVTSTVPQQYLFMMNSPFMTGRAQVLGDWMRGLSGPLAHQLRDTYKRLYSRPPEPAELQLASEWLGKNPAPERWHRYAQMLLSAHELIQIQ